jgi:hypothetical protein
MINLKRILVVLPLALLVLAPLGNAQSIQAQRRSLERATGIKTSDTETTNTRAVNIAGVLTASKSLILPFAAVSVTSPTAAASVANRTILSLTTNVSQTNFSLTGGKQGQVVIVRGTSDSATTTFADGQSSMTLTADAALGLNDTLTLICVDEDGDEWAEVSRALN